MRSLDPGDVLFVGAFVAAICFVIAGFLYIAAPPALPGFTNALLTVFIGLGGVFLFFGLLGAGLVYVFGDDDL